MDEDILEYLGNEDKIVQMNYHAILTIHDLPTITPAQRKKIHNWLMIQAIEINSANPKVFKKKSVRKLMKIKYK
jgi:hypothetical protein